MHDGLDWPWGRDAGSRPARFQHVSRRVNSKVAFAARESSMVVQAYILIQTDVGKAAEVANAIAQVKGVTMAEDVTGPYDVIVRAEARNVDELGKLVKRGRLAKDKADALLAKVTATPDFGALRDCQLVIEAVFEEGFALKLLHDLSRQPGRTHTSLNDQYGFHAFAASAIFVPLRLRLFAIGSSRTTLAADTTL